MKFFPELFSFLYRCTLRCYPRSIREEFGEEMQAVFWEAGVNASRSKPWGMLGVFLRELLDWPFALLNAYMDTLKVRYVWLFRRNRAWSISRGYSEERRWDMTSQDELSSMSKRQAISMAIPPLLLGLGIMFSSMIRTDVWYRLPAWQLYLSVAVVFLPGIIVGIVGLLALFKRIPDWGLTWVGSAFMGFTLSTQVVVKELTEEGWLSLKPLTETALGLSFFFVGFLLLILAAIRGWPRAGLFTIAVACTMGLSLFQSLTAAPFNRDDIALLAGPLGLIFGVLIYVYIRHPGILRILLLVGIGLINGCVAFIATNAWRSWFENRGTASPLIPLLVILTGLLFSGPVSGVILRPIKRLVGGKTL